MSFNLIYETLYGVQESSEIKFSFTNEFFKKFIFTKAEISAPYNLIIRKQPINRSKTHDKK